MKEFTREEWLAYGEKLFGKDVEKWKVRCPMCGKVSTVGEFKEAGADSPDCAFVECIGRYTGQGSPSEAKGMGCNWVAYGLFKLPDDKKYVVTFPDGHKCDCFPFAEEEGRNEEQVEA